MRKILMIAAYVSLFTLANVLVSYFGVWVTPFNALFIIAADMVIRDRIQYESGLMVSMFACAMAGTATVLIDPGSEMIAIASFSSVILAGAGSALVFHFKRGGFYAKSLPANVCASAIDSLAFPLIAFGSVMIDVSLAQFAAKTIGATALLLIMKRFIKT